MDILGFKLILWQVFQFILLGLCIFAIYKLVKIIFFKNR